MTKLGIEKAQAWGAYLIITPDGLVLQPRTEAEVIKHFNEWPTANRLTNHIVKLPSQRYRIDDGKLVPLQEQRTHVKPKKKRRKKR